MGNKLPGFLTPKHTGQSSSGEDAGGQDNPDMVFDSNSYLDSMGAHVDRTAASSQPKPSNKKKSKTKLQIMKQKTEKTKQKHLKNGKFVDEISSRMTRSRSKNNIPTGSAQSDYLSVGGDSMHGSNYGTSIDVSMAGNYLDGQETDEDMVDISFDIPHHTKAGSDSKKPRIQTYR